MRNTGHIHGTAFAALFLFQSIASAAPASEASPERTTARSPRRLSELAIRIDLKAASEDRREGSIVITNDSVARADARGMFTVAGTAAADTGSDGDNQPTDPDDEKKLRQAWRKKVDAQRKRVARTEHEVAIQEGKIKALSNAAFDAGHSSRKAINAWARIETERNKLANLAARLKQEKQELARIFREARQEGAQPGWFR